MGITSEEFFFPEASYDSLREKLPEGFIFPIGYSLSLINILERKETLLHYESKEFKNAIKYLRNIFEEKTNLNEIFYLDFVEDYHNDFLIKEKYFNKKVEYIFYSVIDYYFENKINEKDLLDFLKNSLSIYSMLNNPFRIIIFNSKEDIEELLEKQGINKKYETLQKAQEEIYKQIYYIIEENYNNLRNINVINQKKIIDIQSLLKHIKKSKFEEKIKIDISLDFIFTPISEKHLGKNYIEIFIEYLQFIIKISYFSNLEKTINFIKANNYIQNILSDKQDNDLINQLKEEKIKLEDKLKLIVEDNIEYKKLEDLLYMNLNNLSLATDKLDEAYTYDKLDKLDLIKEKINTTHTFTYKLYNDLIDFDVFINVEKISLDKYFKNIEEKIKDLETSIKNIKIDKKY